MRTSFSMELGFCLVIVPRVNVEVPDINIQSFSNDRTGGDRSVGPVGRFVLVVTLEEDALIDCVDFSDACVVDVVEEGVEENVEVFPTSRTSKFIVIDSDTVKIIDTWFHRLQKFKGIFFRNCRYCIGIFTNFKYIFVIS